MKIAFIILLCLITLSAITCSPSIRKEFQIKQLYTNSYAIENVATGKFLRPHSAGIDDGVKIIQYNLLYKWGCLTWQLIQLEGNAYLLKNLYTQKTFQPSSAPEPGVDLWQQTLGGSRLQYWEFIKQSNETYLIRLKDTELYITATSDENNSPVVLMPKQDSDSQLWKLIRQNPVL
jgi:hypothetical protein